jgi:hypothetical protein
MIEMNECKNKHYQQLVPQSLYVNEPTQSIQKDDETLRIDAFRQTFLNFTHEYKGMSAKKEPSFNRMISVIENIKPAADTEFFAHSFASNEVIPSDFTMSDLNAADSSKRSFIRGRSETTEANDEEEQVLQLGYKKGRKVAIERIRGYDKEIVETDKKLAGLEALLSPSNTTVH